MNIKQGRGVENIKQGRGEGVENINFTLFNLSCLSFYLIILKHIYFMIIWLSEIHY